MALIDLDEEDGTFHPQKKAMCHFGFRREYIMELLEENGFADLIAHDVACRNSKQPDGTLRGY